MSGARTRAEQLLEAAAPTVQRAICTDVDSKPGTVGVGIAIRGIGSALFAVDAAEWDQDWRRNLALFEAAC